MLSMQYPETLSFLVSFRNSGPRFFMMICILSHLEFVKAFLWIP
jgi:hypothetical protein